ncbi:MAG: AAA family ATPase [Pseudomonadota bacterium]
MKTFKFGMLIEKEDICDREKEIALLKKIIALPGGRAVVYGQRRFGKSSVVCNVIIKDFEKSPKKGIAIYADLFQLESQRDLTHRLCRAVETALSEHAKIKTFWGKIQNYIKNLHAEFSIDSKTGTPKISIAGGFEKDEKSLFELFSTINSLSSEYPTLLVLDEFQDIAFIDGMEALLRSEMQKLSKTSIILLGSKRHILKHIFHDEREPFYGFGTDVDFGVIPRDLWVPYMQDRFVPNGQNIDETSAQLISELMDDVPNAIQEFCQWLWISSFKGNIDEKIIREELANLIRNKSNRFLEKMAPLSLKEKHLLHAIAKNQPVASLNSTQFIRESEVSASGAKAATERLVDQGVLDLSTDGYRITDPLFRHFLTTDS